MRVTSGVFYASEVREVVNDKFQPDIVFSTLMHLVLVSYYNYYVLIIGKSPDHTPWCAWLSSNTKICCDNMSPYLELLFRFFVSDGRINYTTYCRQHW